MTPAKFLSFMLLCCVGQTALAAPPLQLVAAAGRWAALRGPGQCDAASLAVLPPTRTRGPGRASVSFDRAQRRGQFAALLSRPVAPQSSVMLTIGDTPFLLVARGAQAWSRGAVQDAAIIAAMRSASGMRIAARAATGVRFVDRYELAGAPTAIDAAAACAATSL